MHCLMCFSSNDKLKKFQSDMDNNTLKKITLVLPHLKIPKSKNPLFICAACLEQVSYFYTIKKASLENCSNLKHFKAMLNGTNISELNNLNIKLYHDEILPEPKHHIELKVNTNHENLLSLEDQNSIYIKEELEENYDLNQQLEKDESSYKDLKVIKSSSSSNESIENDLDVDMKLKDDIEFKVNMNDKNLLSSEDQNLTHIKEELEENCVYSQQLEKDESSFNHLKVSSISSDDSSEDGSEVDMNLGSYDFLDMDKFTETGKEHHECDICQKIFNLKSNLKKHKRVHNYDRPFQCSVCEKRFKMSDLLDRHKLLHTNEKPHKCEVCNKTYRFKPNLTKHMRCHDMGPYQCLECGKAFPRSVDLSVHMRTHNTSALKTYNRFHLSEKPFSCCYCEQSFSTTSNLKEHKRRIHPTEESKDDELIVDCLEDESSSDSSENDSVDMDVASDEFVDEDKLTEKGEDYHECDICKKTFNIKTHLLKHKQEHNLRSFNLFNLLDRDFCNEKYRLKPNLARHIKNSHFDMGPYQCSECGKAFPRSIDLSVHMRTHNTSALKTFNRFHLSEKPFSCSYCEQSFSTTSNLKEHKRRLHPTEESKDDELSVDCLEEEEEELSNDSSENDSVDMDVDSNEFVDENKLTETDSNLTSKNSRDEDQPETPNQNKRFNCTECHKAFTWPSELERHSRVHTGDKPYKCTTCQKTFTRLFSLNTHKLTHTGLYTGEKVECDVCHKTFNLKSTLINHKRIHNNVRPYRCAVCSKRFITSEDLKRHILTHTGEKPHHCHLCEYKGTQAIHLKVHIRSHTGEKPYSCKHCEKLFTTTSNLNEHERRIHSNAN